MENDSQKTQSRRAKEFLSEAIELLGERGLAYGEPAINHLRIAQLWSVYFERAIQPEDVAMAMVLVKIARLVETGSHKDSIVDAAAYLGVYGELITKDWSDLDTY